jgi:hypothetical protein
MNKLIKATIRKLSDVSTELLRNGAADQSLEIQKMIVRLFEIQDQLAKKSQVEP